MKKLIRISLFVGFLFYIIFLILILFYRSNRGADIGIREYLYFHGNLVPFHTVVSYIKSFMEGKINSNLVYRNIFGNLFLFAPLSMFMYVFFKKTKAFLKNAVLVFSCVLFAEVFQMIFRVGSFDVDDIILNMLGAFIGFSVMKIKCIDSLVRSVYN